MAGSSQGKSAAAFIFGRDTPTISAYGDRSTVDQQLDILGLRNVFGDVDTRLIEPNIEEIVDRNPKVITLLLQCTRTPQGVREALRTRPELQNITAVRDDNIIVLPSGFILPSPTARSRAWKPSPANSTRSDKDAMSSRASTSVTTTEEITMTGRALRVLPAILVGLLVLPACTADDEASVRAEDGFPLTVRDCGREFTIEQRPERILTMGSTASTLMWAAGATGAITARAFENVSDLGPAQAALQDVPLISNDNDLTLEVILGQDPDLVITYGLNLTTQEDLAAAGIDSIVNSGFCDGGGSGPADGPVTFEDDVFPDIELYGRIAGTEEAARQKAAELRQRVAAVAEQPRNPEITTAAAIGLNGTNLRAYGVASLTHKQIETLGLTDVFSDIPDRLADVSVEEFIARDPDVVILLSGGGGVEEKPLETLRGLAAVASVTAIRENWIIPLESPYLLGGPLGVDGLEAMAEAISDYR